MKKEKEMSYIEWEEWYAKQPKPTKEESDAIFAKTIKFQEDNWDLFKEKYDNDAKLGKIRKIMDGLYSKINMEVVFDETRNRGGCLRLGNGLYPTTDLDIIEYVNSLKGKTYEELEVEKKTLQDQWYSVRRRLKDDRGYNVVYL